MSLFDERVALVAGRLSTEPPYEKEHPEDRVPLATALVEIVDARLREAVEGLVFQYPGGPGPRYSGAWVRRDAVLALLKEVEE